MARCHFDDKHPALNMEPAQSDMPENRWNYQQNSPCTLWFRGLQLCLWT